MMECSFCWNEAIFNGVRLDDLVKVDHLNGSVTEMIETFSKLKLLHGGIKGGGVTWVRWKKPTAPDVKIDVVGSSLRALMRAGWGVSRGTITVSGLEVKGKIWVMLVPKLLSY